MSKVVSLSGDEIKGPSVRAGVLETLRDAMAMAERGEVESVAVITVSPGKDIQSLWCGSKHNLVAGAVYLQQELPK